MTESKSIVELMGEVQKDEQAFWLLTQRLFAESEHRYVTNGDILREFGDPRTWPEYKNG